MCTCKCGIWSIPYGACSLQFSLIGKALTSVSAVIWFLFPEIQCRLDFLYETKFYIGRALSVTDNEVEIKFLCQVVETFNWPMRSNIDIVQKRILLWLHRAKRH